ncbi:MAG: glycosyltransferase family 4 protein [Hormoscilla sp.]
MKILFLDQSGKPGGAELCLLDIAKPHADSCLVGLFADGSFQELLEQQGIPVRVLATAPIEVRKESNLIRGLSSLGQLLPLIAKVAKIARDYDLIYANTQKALVVGALASFLADRPLVYHLHDILSTEHFSPTNLRLAVTLANNFADLVIANSKATQAAFVAAGGRSQIAEVVYNGFQPEQYHTSQEQVDRIKEKLRLEGRFVVGHFSRLSPWKGQHILLAALSECDSNVTAILVGDALFGEGDYVERLHQQVAELGLEKRVQFLGFREDVVPLMAACDLVAHTSTAPEPFGRVIIEAMLCGRPVVAAAAGGVVELIEQDKTGWLVPPGNSQDLADAIGFCRQHPEKAMTIARQARMQASQSFHLSAINQQIDGLLGRVLRRR